MALDQNLDPDLIAPQVKENRACRRCGKPLPERSRRDKVWCGASCRELASRARREAPVRVIG